MDDSEARALAHALSNLLQKANRALDESRPVSELVAKVTAHLGCALRDLVCVSQTFPTWEHVNLQRGVDAYLGPDVEWFGVSGQGRAYDDIVNLLAVAERAYEDFRIGAVDYTTAATGPDDTAEVITLGLVLAHAPDGAPVVLSVRGPAEQYGDDSCRIDVLAALKPSATATRAEIERLMQRNDVFRGQILTFGESEYRGNRLVTFLPRPALGPDEVILPEGVLDTIERHVISIGEHADALRAHGQHLKRGLLLHGPPGTGKTHTIRYLMGRMPGVTVIVMTGPGMGYVSHAAALARRLQPAIVVVEDVDLVAEDRDFSDGSNPILFTLLDAMDGIGADADVTFVLTTNRAEVLEDALANRPGRVDLAVEVPRPDAEGRLALLRLYGRDLGLAADLEPIVARTEGMTASFFKELMRRAVLVVLRERSTVTTLTGKDLETALEEMLHGQEALTRVLLGSGRRPRREPADPHLNPNDDDQTGQFHPHPNDHGRFLPRPG